MTIVALVLFCGAGSALIGLAYWGAPDNDMCGFGTVQ